MSNFWDLFIRRLLPNLSYQLLKVSPSIPCLLLICCDAVAAEPVPPTARLERTVFASNYLKC